MGKVRNCYSMWDFLIINLLYIRFEAGAVGAGAAWHCGTDTTKIISLRLCNSSWKNIFSIITLKSRLKKQAYNKTHAKNDILIILKKSYFVASFNFLGL
jgi:hypothetical protein